MSNDTPERVERNDPVSALAIRLLVASGACTQEQANTAFHAACTMLEQEAERQNLSLPWVVRKSYPLTPEQIAQHIEAKQYRANYRAARWAFEAGVRYAETAHGISA